MIYVHTYIIKYLFRTIKVFNYYYSYHYVHFIADSTDRSIIPVGTGQSVYIYILCNQDHRCCGAGGDYPNNK